MTGIACSVAEVAKDDVDNDDEEDEIVVFDENSSNKASKKDCIDDGDACKHHRGRYVSTFPCLHRL